jgi:tungstate transport system substrate-binding protein
MARERLVDRMKTKCIISMLALSLLCLQCKAGPKAPPAKDEPGPAPVKKDIILATTTSTQDSGLLDELVPLFEKETGFVVKTIAVGSGQAMAMGKRGDADVLLVHSPEAEGEFMAQGYGLGRRLVMHNDFVIVGPAEDPGGVKGGQDAAAALKALAASAQPFVSRADDSGTHAKERGLWKEAGIDPAGKPWYMETGSGMGQTLSVASEKAAYTLTDRGTYLALRKTLHLDILVEGDPVLHNVYHVIELDPEKFPKVNSEGGRAFADFMVSGEAQALIRTFGTQKFGQPLFFPDAGGEEKKAAP